MIGTNDSTPAYGYYVRELMYESSASELLTLTSPLFPQLFDPRVNDVDLGDQMHASLVIHYDRNADLTCSNQ